MRLAVGVVVISVATLGCAAEHVTLSVPPKSASVDERRAVYEKLRPVGARQTMASYPNGAVFIYEDLKLANGVHVYYPEDILPVVAPDSTTAKLVAESASDRDAARTCGTGTLISTAALLGFGAFAVASSPERRAVPFVGLVLSLGSIAGFSIARYVFKQSASDNAMEAYEHYDDDLQDQLGLCVGARCGHPAFRDMKGEP